LAIPDACLEGYRREDVICRWATNDGINITDHYCPEEYRELYNQCYEEVKAEKQNGIIYNNTLLALKVMNICRTDEEERHMLYLSFSKVEYLHHCAMQKLFCKIAATKEKRALLLCENEKSEIDYTTVLAPHFSTSFGVNIGLFTVDKKVVFTKRSRNVSNPGGVNFSISEGMITKDINSNGVPDMWDACKRALKEELGIELNEDELKTLKIVCIPISTVRHEYSIFGYLDMGNPLLRACNQLTEVRLREQIKNKIKVKDSYEIGEMLFEEMNSDNLGRIYGRIAHI